VTSRRTGIAAAPYRLDPEGGCLWRGTTRIKLSATDSALLGYFAAHPGRLVSHEELLTAVWPGVSVTPGVLKVRVRRLRRALGDRVDRPRFIETVHRRGYRFIADVTGRVPATTRSHKANGVATRFVGRDTELEVLRHHLDLAATGARQVVFVVGEPGIGKSALVSEFVARAADPERMWIGHGQCIEAHGAAEAYMPVLEALGRACRGPGGERLQRHLRKLAPSWLAQMPALLSTRQAEALRHETAGATRERMVRELAEALDVVTADRPMLLWLEDMHWSDASSLTLLSALAQRADAARLLIVATYRPVDALSSNPPLLGLGRELETHGRCRALSLGHLSLPDVEAYLAARFPCHAFPAPFPAMLQRRTEGQPLFLVATVDDLVADGEIAQVAGRWTLRTNVEALNLAVPATIRQLVARQRERLSPAEQETLAAASVVGPVFSAPLVAAALERAVAEAEDTCTRLAERQLFVRPVDVVRSPDRTAAASYAFVHAVYQALWHERVGVSTRRAWHRRIAERLERAHGDQSGEIAAELAMHFEAAGSVEKATQYLQRASANALRRNAPHEAIALARKGLTLVETMADARERAEAEWDLRLPLARVQITTGYAAPDELQNYARLRELCRDRGDDPRLVTALFVLGRFYLNRAEFATSRELAEQMLRIAERSPERSLASAHTLLGGVHFHLGRLPAARQHLVSALSLHDPRRSERLGRLYLDNVDVASLGYMGVVLWHLGYPDQALASGRAAMTAARTLGLPGPVAFALALGAWVHRLRREPAATEELARQLVPLATEYGFSFWVASGMFELGWARAAQGQAAEGRALMCEGLERYGATAARMHHVGNVIAQIEVESDAPEARASALAKIPDLLATVDRTGQRYHEPALYRLHGELLLDVAGDERAAETSFQRAIAVAAEQCAKLPELQATTSLARLWQRQGRTREARAALERTSSWFTEGFDTPDLRDARMFVDDLDRIVRARQHDAAMRPVIRTGRR
jgi:DNA-binding winged helix-turn-helix (wHTH) protein/tetratricopeptide (TPR) repeat protein